MVRGEYIQRSGSERLTLEKVRQQYLREVSPTKKPTPQRAEATKAQQLIRHLGKYSLAALSSEVIANYRDTRLGSLTNRGNPTSNNTVRLELALLSHLFTVAIQEWGLGLTFNPVLNIRKPSPGEGRDRRLSPEEERRLLAAVNNHSNPILGGSSVSLWKRECALRKSQAYVATKSISKDAWSASQIPRTTAKITS